MNKVWMGLVVCSLLSMPSVANDGDKSMFYDDYMPLCTLFGGRLSRGNDITAEGIYTTCKCINTYIIDNTIEHEGLRVDLAIGVFSKMEYYMQRDGLPVDEQFHHIAEAIQQCPIE